MSVIASWLLRFVGQAYLDRPRCIQAPQYGQCACALVLWLYIVQRLVDPPNRRMALMLSQTVAALLHVTVLWSSEKQVCEHASNLPVVCWQWQAMLVSLR